MTKKDASAGYTLLELLLYIGIIGALLTSVTMFFGAVVDARVKNQSISEVDQQGELIMSLITQTIRNADSITSPAAGASDDSLTITVPTGVLSPTIFDLAGATVLGYNTDGTTTDTSNSNVINATSFTAGASGTVSMLYARVGPVIGASPNNKAQMAIYSGATPTTQLAVSGDVVLTPGAWNAFPIPTITVASGTTYWLAYNTNGTASTQNDLRYHAGAAGQARFFGQTYGAWPASWVGVTQAREYSVYAHIVTGSNAIQIKEGAGSAVPLSNSKVQVSGLTFTNLTRPGTPGVVQVSFTVSRVNAANRNEYDYQKTFTTTAALRWP